MSFSLVQQRWKVLTTKVKGAQFLCSCKLLSFFRFWSKNGRRAHSLVGSLPQDWEGWRTSYLVCCNCWWQDQGEAWDCNQPCASNWVYSNILANWASPSSPQCASKGSPQPACSCTPGCPGWGSNQSFAGSSTPSPSSPSSFTTSWIREAPSDGSGEAGRADLLQCGRPLITPTTTATTSLNATTFLLLQLWRGSPLPRLWKVCFPVHWALWMSLRPKQQGRRLQRHLRSLRVSEGGQMKKYYPCDFDVIVIMS